MPDEENQPPHDESALPVPDLIEQYRVRRQEWMAQADQLARLRDEVRGSAEREAMEIVTAARRDIRQIVVEARRELFVLSAQVQAALGDAVLNVPSTVGSLPSPVEELESADDLSTFTEDEWGFAPRATVRSVLEEARADMAILAQDARAVQARPDVQEPAAPPLPPPETDIETPQAAREPLIALPASMHFAVSDEPATRRSILQFGAVAVAVTIVVVLATAWSLRAPRTTESAAGADPGGAAVGTTPGQAAAAAGPGAAARSSGAPIRLALEATRTAWIRAIVDGRPDSGQTLRAGQTSEFEGMTSISLRLGDAGAVRVSVNGGEARTLGRDGEVVNRQFTAGDAPSADAPSAPAAAQPSEPDAPDARSEAVEPPPAPAAAAIPDSTRPALSPAIPINADAVEPSRPAAVESRPTAAPADDSELVLAAQQWLDAYHRQDRAALASLSTADLTIADERPTEERFPAAVGRVARSFERLNVQAAADTAVLTAVMIERAVNGGLQRSSPVSMMWISNEGTWRLTQVRLVSEARLTQIFR